MIVATAVLSDAQRLAVSLDSAVTCSTRKPSCISLVLDRSPLYKDASVRARALPFVCSVEVCLANCVSATPTSTRPGAGGKERKIHGWPTEGSEGFAKRQILVVATAAGSY
jgi:hypothetical protein